MLYNLYRNQLATYVCMNCDFKDPIQTQVSIIIVRLRSYDYGFLIGWLQREPVGYWIKLNRYQRVAICGSIRTGEKSMYGLIKGNIYKFPNVSYYCLESQSLFTIVY